MTLLIEAAPSVRTLARQQGIDLQGLLDILQIRRPDKSAEEEQFVFDVLDVIPGMFRDTFGNRFLQVGQDPIVMWSCHTDTVASDGGRQNLRWRGDILELNQPKQGHTLGADDGAGLWLMLEMIKADRPGLYIFHRAEEVGGLGSKDIAKNNPEYVAGIKMAIAFDRKATKSIITFQRSQRCCSDAFGNALAAKLNATPGLDYDLDKGGVFTDTASYTSLIPECTNLSAGYYDEHTSRETLDVAHLLRLREALLALDVTDLPIERDMTKSEYDDDWGYGYGNYGGWSYGQSSFRDTELDKIEHLVRQYPYSTSKWLRKIGLTGAMLDQLISPGTASASSPAKHWQGPLADLEEADEDEEVEDSEVLYCRDCESSTDEVYFRNGITDGEACPECESNNTEVTSVVVNIWTREVVEHA